MQMNAEQKYKDALPADTVARIQAILAAHGIETAESRSASGVRHCHSMRVSVQNAAFGANGKGMTEDYSRASGYAEFMERLQAGYLQRRVWRDQMLDFPDEKQLTPDACAASCAVWLEQMRTGAEAFLGREVPAWQVFQKAFEAEGDRATVAALPFYDPIHDETAYFPKKAMPFLYNTNGLAAGNNLIEAAVQSLSEIYERYNLLKLFFGNEVPPAVPEEVLRSVPKLYEVIEDLRAAGLRVLVKDCSFGEPFPVLAAVVIDPVHHAYHVHLGAFPVFEIALERSFTELFQGRTLQTVADTTSVTLGDPQKRSNAELIQFLTKGCGRYPLSFFSDRPTYPFRAFPDRAAMTNAELLHIFAQDLERKGRRLYLRDLSHLGFPAIRIVVPGMSEIMPTLLIDRFPISWMLEQYRDAPLRSTALTAEQRTEYRMLLDYLAANYGEAAYDVLFLSGKNPDRTNHNVSRFLGRILYGWMEWERDPARAMRFARLAQAVAEPRQRDELACLCAFREQICAGQDPTLTQAGLSALFDEQTAAEAARVVLEGENPFAGYLLHCAEETCADCPFHETCSGWTNDRLIEKMRGIVSKFDADGAMARLREQTAFLRAGRL